jgi:hypothetical protein
MQPPPPSTEELRASGLGLCPPERAAQIEAFLLRESECSAVLRTPPADAVVAHRHAAEVARQLSMTANAEGVARARVLSRLRAELAGMVDA